MLTVRTKTRRGLVLTLYSEVLVGLGLVAFIVFPEYPSLLVWAVVASMILGVPAGYLLYTGRHEFGQGHAHSVRKGALAFAVLGVSLVLAFYQVTAVFPETLRLLDLRAPWFFLGLAVLADAAAMWLLLRHLAGQRARHWLLFIVAVAIIGSLFYAFLGWGAIEDYVRRSGTMVANTAEADSYVRDFVFDVVKPFAGVLLMLRIGFWPALWASIVNVAEAEQDMRHEAERASVRSA